MKALLIVDLQNDFCPGGALPAPDGDQIVPVINKLMDRFDFVLASKDWHPVSTIHFKKWPVHCVRNSNGAEFHPDLTSEKIDKVFFKGTDDKDDGYSAFEASNEDLADYLRNNHINEIYVSGLTVEYCVKQTVLDSLKQGFKTFLILDAAKGIGKYPNDISSALDEMKKAGAYIIKSDIVLGTFENTSQHLYS